MLRVSARRSHNFHQNRIKNSLHTYATNLPLSWSIRNPEVYGLKRRVFPVYLRGGVSIARK